MVKIETVGLEQYAPGGNARVQMLLIGGPGAGKTRTASFWPKPLYADCERGLASVADRGVDAVKISSSRDMLDLLQFCRLECTKPVEQRRYRTLVVDTVDAYQRIVQDEWVQQNRAPSFTGGEAWGYLDGKMQILMRRALNLDMNVVMLVHFERKSAWGDDEVRTVLQMQGKAKDQIFNDFDLVGWIGREYDTNDEGERVQIRAITFEPTPERDFLKDRFGVMPKYIPIEFSERDYVQLLEAVQSRVADIPETTEVGEIEHYDPRLDAGSTPQGMPTLESVSGPLESASPAIPDLSGYKKAELVEMAEGVGLKLPSGALKADYRDALEEHFQRQAAGEEKTPELKMTGTLTQEEPAPAPEPEVEEPFDATEEEAAAVADLPLESDESADVDDSPEEAEGEGDFVLSDDVCEAPVPEDAEGAIVTPDGAVCGRDLTKENQDYVTLARIKHRKNLCLEHFQAMN